VNFFSSYKVGLWVHMIETNVKEFYKIKKKKKRLSKSKI